MNWLLFRFGFRFVFLVDSSAIINVRYEPSIDGKHGGEESKDTMQSPPLKRNKSGSTAECNDADRTDASPASLVVSFPLCSFRIFFLQNKSDDSAPVDTKGRSFLLKAVMTAEEKLLKARSMLLKQFELDQEEEWMQNRLSSSRKQASGECRKPFENRSIPPFLASKESKYLDEDWSFCIDVNKTLPCNSLPLSPQNCCSPSKNGGNNSAKDSSSFFENGQKVEAPANPLHKASKEERGETSTESDGVNSSEFASEGGEGDLEEVNYKSEVKGIETNDVYHKTVGRQDTSVANENDLLRLSWKHELLNKRCNFDASWESVQNAVHDNTIESLSSGNVSHLTHAAQSLSSSYLTSKELSDKSSQCEDDIEFATKGIEKEIEKLFPGRLSRKPAGNPPDLGNFKEKIEHLLRLRKESVEAKIALLFTPKR